MKYIVHYNLEHHNFILDPLRGRKDIVMIPLPVEVSPLCKFLIKIDHHLNLNRIPAYRYRKTTIDILKYIDEQDEIILFNITYPMDIAWISKITGNHCLHVWNWNPIFPQYATLYENLRKRNVVFYTFDERDAKTYSMNYLPQVFRRIDLSGEAIRNDFIFIGLDKNRANFLDDLAVIMEKSGYKGIIKIVGATNYTHAKSRAMITNVPLISYKELIKAEYQSRVIIDIVQPNQAGLTLRVMEALFMKKKLITNNISLNNYSWYHPNNILILENATETDIRMFMEKDYVAIDSNNLSNHEITNWINNFNN